MKEQNVSYFFNQGRQGESFATKNHGHPLMEIFLTFDDVLIRPNISDLKPAQVDIRSFVTKNIKLNIPVLSAAMDRVTEVSMAIALGKLGGLGVLHRNNSVEEQINMVKEIKAADLLVAAACGPTDLERAQALDETGCDIIVLDSAHGHNTHVVEGARRIKQSVKAEIIVGNIATAESAEPLCEFADAIKVGIGPGSICTTRIVSGVGVPQISAILEVAAIARKYNVPVIADGGMHYAGDAAKALAAGASTVMFGSMFAGTDEAPGTVITKDGMSLKEYRGMGSASAMASNQSSDRYLQKDAKKKTAEGVEAYVPVKGPLEPIIDELTGGINLAFSYVGAPTISSFHERARLIQITPASMAESKPHGVIQ